MRTLLTVGLAAALTAGVMAQRAQLEVGDMAPDFTLQGTDGQTHQLSAYRGQTVVVAWFPKAFTTGCTIECKSLAENGDRIQQFVVTYFMASVDSIEENTAFANATSVDLGERGGIVEKEEADFPMLADPHDGHGQGVWRSQRPERRGPLDVLYRPGRPDLGHRQSRAARHVGRGHDRQAQRARHAAPVTPVRPGILETARSSGWLGLALLSCGGE